MAFSVKILADSLAPCGKRLTTFEATYSRTIHSEILTHKALSRNSASSRAIPTEKLIQRVVEDPFIPMYIGTNQKGMQAGDELPEALRLAAQSEWLDARDKAVEAARRLMMFKVHKQVVNRLIEPWMWITVIISATELDNFFGLRDHTAAEPHFQHLARGMREVRDASTPKKLAAGEWHLPLIYDEDREKAEILKREFNYSVDDILKKVSVGRCARVSYLTHDGRRDLMEDVGLHDKLMVQSPLHGSPAEHPAQALDWPQWFKETCLDTTNVDLSIGVQELQNRVLTRRKQLGRDEKPPSWVLSAETALSQLRSGNFIGFAQYRKSFPSENIGGLMP